MSAHSVRRRRFEDAHGFPLDPFQHRALDSVDAGRSVLVAAPTGSGKTVVGEYAIEVALDSGHRVFYTTPIKALSNQKYNDLVARHGRERVGLLTGDNAINGTAPVVVMTTEVLRNMIYARSPALDMLRWVVLDEVHYLQDEYRGPVWEEVIIHSPPSVRLVALSATVSNAEELADWITSVRGPTDVVVETERPVELVNHYLVGDRQSDRLHLIDTLPGGRPNPEGHRYDIEVNRGQRGKGRERRRWYTPRRVEVLEMLAERNLLPAITFIFSRAACDDAVKACLDSGLRLTTAPERERIAQIVDQHLADMDDADLVLLGYDRWRAGLEIGVAAHHAGMVPPFKEAVEQIFVEGLAKAVFATETLALGINMPARTVVIEKLSKWGGDRHAVLTPGQYTQLTGRAGRRGIDSIGHAVVLWTPFVGFDEVASLAGSRSFELDSAFRPTYNMAANLVRRYDADEAIRLLEHSFAQFRSDRVVVRLSTRIDQRRRRRDEAAAAATCDRGDIGEYRELVRRRERSTATADDISRALAGLAPGDVIAVEKGPAAGAAAVISVSERRGGAVKIRALGQPRHLISLGIGDFTDLPQTLGRIDLPTPYAPNNSQFLNEARRRLRRADVRPPSHRQQARRARRGPGRVGHPVEDCPDLDVHLKAARQLERLERELDDLDRQRRRRTAGLGAQFERILDLLEDWDHLAGWSLTPAGEVLARIYHESDLLVSTAMGRGLLDDLDPPTLAGVVSAFTYEHRSAQPPPDPWFPPGPMAERIAALDALARDLNRDETRARLPTTRPPDPGFAALAHAWASGDGLDDVLAELTVSGGDFVRNVKQLIDLLHQIGAVAPDPDTASHARRAADGLRRGVVVASSAVGTGADDDEPLAELSMEDPGDA
jgi:ATP-dependent RNA helicase HelY